MSGAGGRSGWPEWVGERAPRPFGQMIWPFENRPFLYFRPKIQLAFRVSAFRYKPAKNSKNNNFCIKHVLLHYEISFGKIKFFFQIH